jgi:hypothetical protein
LRTDYRMAGNPFFIAAAESITRRFDGICG